MIKEFWPSSLLLFSGINSMAMRAYFGLQKVCHGRLQESYKNATHLSLLTCLSLITPPIYGHISLLGCTSRHWWDGWLLFFVINLNADHLR